MILSVQGLSFWSSTEVGMRDGHTEGRKETRNGAGGKQSENKQRNTHQNRLISYFSQF